MPTLPPALRPILLLALATPAAAQSVPLQFDPIPIHGEADGRAWAAGPDYKVAFDAAGMTFFPVLGESAPQNLPFGWRTVSIGYSGAPTADVLDAAFPTTSFDATRFDIARGTTIERYLVRADGVEQQFVLLQPPSTPGDFVVRGRVDGPLSTADRAPAHAPLVFHAVGDPTGIVEYGAAIAIDAVGARLPLTTTVEGGVVELRVPQAFLATATWPVVVDPLTSRSSMLGAATSSSFPSIARDDSTGRVLVSRARASAATDWDLFVTVVDSHFSSLAPIYSELTPDSVRRSSAAWSAVTQTWLVAMEVQNATSWRVRVLLHDSTDLNFGTGSVSAIPHSAGYHLSAPRVAASASQPTCFLVATSDYELSGPMDTNATLIAGYAIYPATGVIGSRIVLDDVFAGAIDAQNPQITSQIDDSGFVVVWQQWIAGQSAGWDVVGARISHGGGFSGDRALLLAGSDHELTPMVAGDDGRYLVAAVQRPLGDGSPTPSILGDRIVTRRFDWTEGAPSPTTGPIRVLDTPTPTNAIQLGFGSRPITFDPATRSHWTLSWQRTDLDSMSIARLGYDGLVTESTLVEPPAPIGIAYGAASLCHDATTHGAIVVYSSSGAALGDPLFARRFNLPSTAMTTNFGAGCAGTTSATNGTAGTQPWRGSEFLDIALTGGRPSAPTWLMLAPFAGSTPLPLAGPGCVLLLDPNTLQAAVASGVTDASGAWSVPFRLPSSLPNLSAYWQFVQHDGGMLWGSSGLRTDVR